MCFAYSLPIFLLLFHCASPTVHLEASWLGDPSLFPQSTFTMLLFNLTSAASASIEPMSVDMVLGKQARDVFPNASLYSFSIVYITRIQCELTTANDYAAMTAIQTTLASASLQSGIGHMALDYVSTDARQRSTSWQWPDYMAPLVISGWSVTAFICVLLIIALCVSQYYNSECEQELTQCKAALVPPGPGKSARAPTLQVPRYAAKPAPRELRSPTMRR